MRFTWTNVTQRRILVSNFGMTCNSLCEFSHAGLAGLGMSVPFRRIDFGGVMSWNTQPKCRASERLTFRWILSQFLITSLPRFLRSIVTLVGNRFSVVPTILLQHGYCTLVIIRFGPFRRLFINLDRCANEHFFPKPTTTLGLVEQAFWRVPLFTKWTGASSFEVILARQSRHSATGTSSSGTLGFSMIFAHSAAWKNSETDLMV